MHQNITHTVTVQQALAMLVVNPAASLRLLETRDPSSVGLEMSDQTKSALISFLSTHGRAFRTSVLLLRKRRLDSVLDTLTVVSRLFSEYELACYWDDYLASIAIEERCPKNPLFESLHFCRYVLGSLSQSDPHAALMAYDLARNEVMAAIATDGVPYYHDPANEDSGRYAPFLHPSSRVEAFPTNVGVMVKMLADGISRNLVIEASTGQPEVVLFFKNWKRGGVGSLRLNAPAKKALTLLNGQRSTKDLIEEYPALTSLLSTLDAAGAVARVAIREIANES